MVLDMIVEASCVRSLNGGRKEFWIVIKMLNPSSKFLCVLDIEEIWEAM